MTLFTTILAALPAFLAALAAFIAAIRNSKKMQQNAKQIQEVHLILNGRLDSLLEATAKVAHLEGRNAERAENATSTPPTPKV